MTSRSSTVRLSFQQYSSIEVRGGNGMPYCMNPPPPKSESSSEFNLTFNRFVESAGPLPGYRRIIAEGGNATTPLNAQDVKVKMTSGSAVTTTTFSDPNDPCTHTFSQRVTRGPFLTGVNIPSYGVTEASLSSAQNQAIAKFVQKATSEMTPLQGVAFLGELGKALSAIKSPARALRHGVQDYLNTLKKARRKIPNSRKRRFLSETWLEYSYGWKPLIFDIDNGMRALAQSRYARPVLKRIMAEGYSEGVIDPYALGFFGDGSRQGFYNVIQHESYRYKLYGAIKSSAESPVGFAAQNFGFDPASFVPSIWELVPYSFLVDYFTNIGDVIQSWSFRRGDLAWVSYGQLATVKRKAVNIQIVPIVQPVDHRYHISGSIDPGEAEIEARTVSRNIYQGSLIPSFEFRHPDLSSLKWVNLAALARTHSDLIPF